METKMEDQTFSLDEYAYEIVDNKLIVRAKRKYSTQKEIMKNAISSSIQECIVYSGTTLVSEEKKWSPAIRKMWAKVDKKTLREITTFNIMYGDQEGHLGYNYCEELQISHQNKDARGCFAEMVNLCEKLNMTLQLTLKIESGEILYYKG